MLQPKHPEGSKSGLAHFMGRALLGLALASTAQAGVLVQTQEAIHMPPLLPGRIQAAPVSPSQLEAAPIEPLPLQRLDAPGREAASEIEALIRLAEGGTGPNALQSKRRPQGNSTSLAPGNAAWTLGLIYLHGAGAPQDLALAQSWFERALKLGARQALAGMAWCAIEGCRAPPDPAKADQWTVPLRAINLPLAQYLQWLAQERMAPLHTATLDMGRRDQKQPLIESRLLVSSARAGNVHALIELGLNALAYQQPEQALKYFRSAAPQSEVAAINASLVAQLLQSEPQGKSDASKPGLELLTEAQRFHRGDGVPVNYSEAIRLYRLAAAKGSPEAERMLALIYSRPLVNGGFDLAWMSQLGALDLSQAAPSLRTPSQKRQLQRERTPLVDLLPAKWRGRIL